MLTCHFCSATVSGTGADHDDVDAAIEAGWMPSFRIGDEQVDEPFCAACSANQELFPLLAEGDPMRDAFVLSPAVAAADPERGKVAR